MSERTSIIEEVARETSLDEKTTEPVVEEFCRQLHKRLYEYEGLNGDYICEELLYELGDFSWIHLYMFLAWHRRRYGTGNSEDDFDTSMEQLSFLGGAARWNKHLRETESWQTSSRWGPKK